MKKKKVNDPRNGEYSVIKDDDDWLRYDEEGRWGGDDSHIDMINYVPTDWGLILWKTDGGRERWLARADYYTQEWSKTGHWPDDLGDPPDDHPFATMIRERATELDARFDRFAQKRIGARSAKVST